MGRGGEGVVVGGVEERDIYHIFAEGVAIYLWGEREIMDGWARDEGPHGQRFSFWAFEWIALACGGLGAVVAAVCGCYAFGMAGWRLWRWQ